MLFWIIGSGIASLSSSRRTFAFQSLLFWIIGSGTIVACLWIWLFLVSILVVLDHWFGLFNRAFTRRDRHVSILVVLDHWFGPVVVTLPELVATSFNPCCFGSLVRAFPQSCQVPFKLMGFNPCCFGSLVRATILLAFRVHSRRVSILVVLDHWFGLCTEAFGWLSTLWFQSLLFWIIGSGERMDPRGSKLAEFQSLLFWIIGSGYNWDAVFDWLVGFNPCCFGSLVRACTQ